MANEEQNDDENPGNGYLKYSSMGFQMIVIIGGFTYAGYKIDESAKHQVKWVTAILSLAGVFISLYLVIRSAKS
jgi:ATP synthase protein I